MLSYNLEVILCKYNVCTSVYIAIHSPWTEGRHLIHPPAETAVEQGSSLHYSQLLTPTNC